MPQKWFSNRLLAMLTLLSTTAVAQSPTPTYWAHNGSVVYLVAKGAEREFHYSEPRASMLEVGARPGSLLFTGKSINGRYVGIAYIFNSRCGQIPYQVSGPILDGYERVVLEGQAPRVGAGCRIIGYLSDTLEFTLLKPGGVNAPNAPADTGRQPEMPKAEHQVSSGTGFFVSIKGHVLTNFHVVKDCKTFTLSSDFVGSADGHLLASDPVNDLAVLATKLTPSAVPAFNSRARVGDGIFVYGFPLAGLLSTSGNFTMGNITATAGLNDDTSMFQISAPVQPGSSGGPVVDQFGNVIGVIVSKLNAISLAKITDDIAQNVNFAIKGGVALNFLESHSLDTVPKTSDQRLEPANIAELAKQFTVRVTCQ